MPRKIRTEAKPADVDRKVAEHRCRQLSLRLKMCGAAAEGTPLRRQLDAAMEIPDARARLTAVLDLADQVRPMLPPDVQRHTMPETVNRWRSPR